MRRIHQLPVWTYVLIAAALVFALLAGWFMMQEGQTGTQALVNDEVAVDAGQEAAGLELASIDEVPAQKRAVASAQGAAVPMEEPSAPALGATVGALEVSVRWSDGLPAVEEGVTLEWWFAQVGVLGQLQRKTDGAGAARFEGLVPGEYKVSNFRTKEGDEQKAVVVAGETVSIDLEISAGLQVVGRVTNTDGHGIAGAEIWVESTPGGWASGQVTTSTDEAGEYRLRDLPENPSLGALAAGYAPSQLIDLDLVDKLSTPVRVDFVVRPGGGSLEGTVTDADGLPVEGAVVAAGEHDGTYDMRPDESVTETWTFRHTTTDADGRYRFGTLALGEVPLAVRKPGYPQWSGSVLIEGLQTQRKDVSLDRGAAVVGIVRDEDGNPVEAARIQAFTAPLPEDFLQNGQVDFSGPFGQAVTLSARNGSYALELLPHRSMYLYAMEPRPAKRSFSQLVRFTKAEIDLSGGGQHSWDPVLSDGAAIEGVVRYRDGDPIENVFVHLVVTEGIDEHRRATPTDSGSFKFIQLPGAAYNVSAQIWNLPEGSKEPQLLGVVPGTGPIELVADFDAPVVHESSKVTLRIIDAANRAKGGKVSAVLESTSTYSWWFGEQDADGLWTFELKKPGAYRPLALFGERIIAGGEVFEFTPGEDLDLGVLRTKPGGTLVLHMDSSEEHPPLDVKGSLAVGGYRLTEEFVVESVSSMRFESLEPGQGVLSLSGQNILMGSHEFEIRAGEETVLDIELSPAVGVPYRIDLPKSEADMSLVARFVDLADGSEAGKIELKDLSQYSSPIEFKMMLGVGSYRMESEVSDGRRDAVEFEVTSLEPDLAPKPVLDLR